MAVLKRRDTQTIVKHEILDKYLRAWSGIIIHGLRNAYQKVASMGRGPTFRAQFIYVDGLAYRGRYASEGNDQEPVFGSPIIGIRALDDLKKQAQKIAGFTPTVKSILIEKEEEDFAELLTSLDLAGLGSRVRETEDFLSLQDDEIGVLNGNFHDYVYQLLALTGQGYTWAFYFIDPYGASGIPLRSVSPIIAQERTDVMINFPYLHLHRRSGSAARNSQNDEAQLAHHDAMFGNQRWRKIAEKYFNESSDARREEMENALVDLYEETLHDQDQSLAIKSIRLKFQTIERTMFYLFLTTHDGTGALSLNEILDEADLRQNEIREQRRHIKGDFVQQSMFDIWDESAEPHAEEPDYEIMAGEIHDLFKGEILKYREVLRRLADTPYYIRDVEQALKLLMKEGNAGYRRLSYDEEIKFQG